MIHTMSRLLIPPNRYVKAGSIIFLIVLVLLVGLTLWFFTNISNVEQSERRLVWAVAVSMPSLTVRVIYSIICAFTKNSKYFTQFGTNTIGVVIHGVMGLLPEIVVVVIYLWAGLTAKKLDYNVSDAKAPGSAQGAPMDGPQMRPVQGV